MKLYIYPNIQEYYAEDVRDCIALIEKKGHQCFLSDADYQRIFNQTCPYEANVADCDMIVSIGGDGTLIGAKNIALEYDKPLVGINIGRLGYLCALTMEDLKKHSDFSYLKETERTLVCVEYEGKTYTALNDIVIGKNNFGTTVTLKAEVDDSLMTVRGDGLIISTPTGSTSYNYSANGPVISYKTRCFALTPICAHYSSSHSMVYDDSEEVRICVINPLSNDASIYVDGSDLGLVNTELTIKKYEKTLRLISIPKNFLNER